MERFAMRVGRLWPRYERAPAGAVCRVDGEAEPVALLGWHLSDDGRRLFAQVARPSIVPAYRVHGAEP